MAKLLLVLAAAVAVCAAMGNRSLREKRQAVTGFNCQNQNGPIADPSDCSFFIQCDNGIGTRKGCPAGLEFNPQATYCDWPTNMPNPQCNRVSAGSARNAPCNGIVGVGQVQHPEFCNAFMTCGNGYLNDGCTFCGEGGYFDDISKKCISSYNVDLQRTCNGKQVIQPTEQEFRRLGPSCYPSDPNIFAPLLAKIQQTGGFRPNNNGGFNNQ